MGCVTPETLLLSATLLANEDLPYSCIHYVFLSFILEFLFVVTKKLTKTLITAHSTFEGICSYFRQKIV